MTKDTKVWIYGMMAAFIGGFAGATEAALILPGFAPDRFNFGPDFKRMMGAMAAFGLLSGIKLTLAYLKQRPLPEETLLTATQTTTTTVTATPADNAKG